MSEYDQRNHMNKLTKSEFIQKLEMAKIDSRDYDNGINRAIHIIGDTEIIPDPVPAVDTELEEAKKRFPVGSWFTAQGYPNMMMKVSEVERFKRGVMILIEHEEWEFYPKECTPATLPTAKWRCMKTDVENSLEGRLVYLGIGHCVNYHIGFYDVAKDRWCVNNQYIDLSCYETFEWLEIPRGE